ncbi:MAG: OsmC family protein [Acidobacteriota bacterium]
MLGTLNGALEVRRVVLAPENIRAEVRGINEIRDRMPVLTRVEIDYHLRIPQGTREVVERALSRHQEKCPTAATLKSAVEIRWTADIEEVD